MVGVLLRVPERVGGTPGLRPRAETLVISIVEESPCDCETTTTPSTTSTSTCPSSSGSGTLTTSSNSASSSPTNNAASPSTFPVLPSTKSGIRTLTQTITHPSTTLTTTLTFTPSPETNNPENPNPNPAPSETIPPSLPTPTIIAIIVVCCVVGTALFYIIYRVYVAQRMTPPPAKWSRAWDIYPPPRRPPKPPGTRKPTKGPEPGDGGVSERVRSEERMRMKEEMRIKEKMKKNRDRRNVDVIIEEGSFSSGGKEGGADGRRRSRVVGLRMEQDQWVRMSRRGSDVEFGVAGSEFENMEEEGGDDLIYMRRRGEIGRRRGDRGEVLVVRRVRVENGRRMEGSGSGGERGKRKPADRGRTRVRGGQRRAGGRYEMTGAVNEHLDE